MLAQTLIIIKLNLKKYIYLTILLTLVQTLIEVYYRVYSNTNSLSLGLMFIIYFSIAVSLLVLTGVYLRKNKINFSNIIMVIPFGISLISAAMLREVYVLFVYNMPIDYFDEMSYVITYWVICFFFSAVAVGVSNIIIPDNYKSKKDSDILDN